MVQELIARSDGLLSPWPTETDRLACVRYGFTFPLRGFRYLMREPTLFRWVFIPLVINVVMIIAAFIGASWGRLVCYQSFG